MKIWKLVRDVLPDWLLPENPSASVEAPAAGDQHLNLARESLRDLLDDPRVPPTVRQSLSVDYSQLQDLLQKLEHGHVHIAVLGRVSVGKSALLNALLGHPHFSTSPLHGETKSVSHVRWEEYDAGGVFLVDTPGINEVDGEARERLAHEVAERSDLVLFVVDGDITDTELHALRQVSSGLQPVLLVLNKADRYTNAELELLLSALARRVSGLVKVENIIATAAQPAEHIVIHLDASGGEAESRKSPPADVATLRERLWDILRAEGKTVVAINASLFAGRLSDRITAEIMAIKRDLAERLVRKYSLGKGIGVALNPIPLADMLSVVADGAMIVHLSRIYGLPVTRTEAGALLTTIISQLALLMGTIWGVNLLSSALKGVSLGLSTIITASAQGAVAWYGTYVVGRAAERYFAQGKSWGDGGPKQTVREILDTLDRDSLLAQAREDILDRLKPST